MEISAARLRELIKIYKDEFDEGLSAGQLNALVGYQSHEPQSGTMGTWGDVVRE